MKELLFLAHRIPYPPNKGDKLRSFNLIKQLGRDYRVHLGAFIDDAHDWKYVDALRAMRGECHFVPLDPPLVLLCCLSALFGGRPLSLPYYRDAGMMRWVQGILRERPVWLVLVYSGPMAQYVERTDTDVRRVMVFVVVVSVLWWLFAVSRRWPLCWVYWREARTLLRYERRIAAAFDASVFVSDSEAALFRRLAPECTPRVWGIHNGVDTAYFDPAQTFAAPYPLYEKPIVFTGAMDYWANVEAVVWFARKVLPIVREADEEARFYIVGARPAAEGKELRRLPGVVVVGAVEDIRPYIAHAALAVAAEGIGRGRARARRRRRAATRRARARGGGLQLGDQPAPLRIPVGRRRGGRAVGRCDSHVAGCQGRSLTRRYERGCGDEDDTRYAAARHARLARAAHCGGARGARAIRPLLGDGGLDGGDLVPLRDLHARLSHPAHQPL